MVWGIATELNNVTGRSRPQKKGSKVKGSSTKGVGKTPMSKGVGSAAKSSSSIPNKAVNKISTKGSANAVAKLQKSKNPKVTGGKPKVKAAGSGSAMKGAGPGRSGATNRGR